MTIFLFQSLCEPVVTITTRRVVFGVERNRVKISNMNGFTFFLKTFLKSVNWNVTDSDKYG